MPPWHPKNLIGNRYGHLVVVGWSGTNRHRQSIWSCRCDCGVTKGFTRGSLIFNGVQTCGAKIHRSEWSKKHGHSVNGGSPEWESWCAMHARCAATNPDDRRFLDYAGRGIRVCARWNGRNGFANFLSDMGPRPSGTTLDRRNNNGNYTPRNCRWATHGEQVRNRRTREQVARDRERIKRKRGKQ